MLSDGQVALLNLPYTLNKPTTSKPTTNVPGSVTVSDL
jgi:hypothetical protein